MTKLLRILILAQHYAPEEVSGAVLATELAEDLAQRGHRVTFLTCAPNYPRGQVFEGYRNRLFQVETRNNVRVIRVWSYISSSKSFLARSLNFGTFSIMAALGGLRAGQFDVLMSYSPPLTLGLAAWMIRRLRKIPWVLRVEDLYPEAAVAAGILRNRFAIRTFAYLERLLYRKATHISVISEGFRKNLLNKGVPDEKVSVAPVWADPDQVRPESKENAFRKTYQMEGKFVVMYAGALGHTSALEDVLQAARQLQMEPDIRFVIVGEGVKKPALVRYVTQYNLKNVLFLPFQPREQFSEMMAAADISLVTLNRASAYYSMPNKVFNIMSSARPILAVTPPDSEIAALVQTWDCGVNVPVDEPQTLAKTIVALSQRPDYLNTLGWNGRKALEHHFARQHCTRLYAQTLQQVAA